MKYKLNIIDIDFSTKLQKQMRTSEIKALIDER